MVVVKLLALALFIGVGLMNLHPEYYTPFAPNGFTGIHQGAAIVFFAYIGFDAISTAAEETKIRSATCPLASSAASRSAPPSTSSSASCWRGWCRGRILASPTRWRTR